MKKNKWGKKECKIEFEEKKNSRKFNVRAKACAERDEKIKERPVIQQNIGRGALTAKPHSAMPKEFSPAKNKGKH